METETTTASTTLDHLYKEYVRLSDRRDAILQSSWDDFKLLGAIGAFIVWPPLAQSDLFQSSEMRSSARTNWTRLRRWSSWSMWIRFRPNWANRRPTARSFLSCGRESIELHQSPVLPRQERRWPLCSEDWDSERIRTTVTYTGIWRSVFARLMKSGEGR